LLQSAKYLKRRERTKCGEKELEAGEAKRQMQRGNEFRRQQFLFFASELI